MAILICADDPTDREFITNILRAISASLHYKANLAEAAKYCLEKPADLVVVSNRGSESPQALNEGIEQLRQVADVPLLVVIEGLRDKETAQLLDSGADIVLPHPISPRLLGSYCRAQLRARGRGDLATLQVLEYQRITLSPMTRKVVVEGKEGKRLTRLEFRLLYVLMTNPGHVISTEQIIDLVWGYSDSGSKELVRGLISRLRSKVEAQPSKPEFIHTISGVGYMFDENGDA
jgi:DNA-binding response OmpR family regulator